jgi:lipid A ethanolaminephosphotransferase
MRIDISPRLAGSGEKERPGEFRGWGAAIAALSVAAFITLFDNQAFFGYASHATLLNEHRIAILVSLGMIQGLTLAILLALVPTVRALKTVSAILMVIAAICGHFMTTYGTVIDAAMIRNAAETSLREASTLLTPGLFWHVALYGLFPSLVLAFVDLGRVSWLRGLLVRSATITAAVAVLVGTVYFNYRPLEFFAQEHHHSRLFFNPGYPIYAYFEYHLLGTDDHTGKRNLEASIVGENGLYWHEFPSAIAPEEQ